MKQFVKLALRVAADSGHWSLDRVWGPGGIDQETAASAVGKPVPYHDTDRADAAVWDRCSRTILVPCGESDALYRIKLLKAVDEAVWERIKELQDVRQGVQRAVEVLTAGSVNEPPEDVVTPSTWMVQEPVSGSDEVVYGKADKTVHEHHSAPPDDSCATACFELCLNTVNAPEGTSSVGVRVYIGSRYARLPGDEDAGTDTRVRIIEEHLCERSNLAPEIVLARMYTCLDRLGADALEHLKYLARGVVMRHISEARLKSNMLAALERLRLGVDGKVEWAVFSLPDEAVCGKADAPAKKARARRYALIVSSGMLVYGWAGDSEDVDSVLIGKVRGEIPLSAHDTWDAAYVWVADGDSVDCYVSALADEARQTITVADLPGDEENRLLGAVASWKADFEGDGAVAADKPRYAATPASRTPQPATTGSNEPSRPSAVTTLYVLSTVAPAQRGGAPGVRITKQPSGGIPLFGEATAVGFCGLLASMAEGQYYSLNLAQMAWGDQPLTEPALAKLRSVAVAVALDNMPDTGARIALLDAIMRLTLDDAANGTVVPLHLQGCSFTQSNCDDEEDDDCDEDGDDEDNDCDEDDEDEVVECTKYAFVAWEEDGDLVVKLQNQGCHVATADNAGEVVLEWDVDLHTGIDDEATLASVCIPEGDELDDDVLEQLIDSATEVLRDAGCEDDFGHNPIDLVADAANEFCAARDRARRPRVVEVSLPPKRTVDVSLPSKEVPTVSLGTPSPKPKGGYNYLTW